MKITKKPYLLIQPYLKSDNFEIYIYKFEIYRKFNFILRLTFEQNIKILFIRTVSKS